MTARPPARRLLDAWIAGAARAWELTEIALEAIEALKPDLNAMVSTTTDRARARAAAAR